MIEALTSVTKEMAVLALDARIMNHGLIANNIANHATEGYVATRLNFDALMSDLGAALTSGARADRLDAMVSDLRLDAWPVQSDTNPVQLDKEVEELTKNTLHYQAIITALGNFGALNKIAIGSTQR